MEQNKEVFHLEDGRILVLEPFCGRMQWRLYSTEGQGAAFTTSMAMAEQISEALHLFAGEPHRDDTQIPEGAYSYRGWYYWVDAIALHGYWYPMVCAPGDVPQRLSPMPSHQSAVEGAIAWIERQQPALTWDEIKAGLPHTEETTS